MEAYGSKKERQEYMRKVCACYNEEMDLWNTGKLAELNKEEEIKKNIERLFKLN